MYTLLKPVVTLEEQMQMEQTIFCHIGHSWFLVTGLCQAPRSFVASGMSDINIAARFRLKILWRLHVPIRECFFILFHLFWKSLSFLPAGFSKRDGRGHTIKVGSQYLPHRATSKVQPCHAACHLDRIEFYLKPRGTVQQVL